VHRPDDCHTHGYALSRSAALVKEFADERGLIFIDENEGIRAVSYEDVFDDEMEDLDSEF
jgi:hypothetical protein